MSENNSNNSKKIKTESRSFIGSRTEVTSTGTGERPTIPKNTKKAS